MITVIIPAYNEERTVGNVVKFAGSAPYVTEVIVIDDQSVDNTVLTARNAGAEVYECPVRGKGTSMELGLRHAKNEIVVFLDADIDPYPALTIELLTRPIINNQLDFTKATFSRQAGRVTEMVAKPLLTILFPNLSKFSQPLSGMIAGKKEWLSRLTFAEGYGVDIGILIDLHLLDCRMGEVMIGEIKNNMQVWDALPKMSKEVATAIIEKAIQQPKGAFNLQELKSLQIVRSQMEAAISENLLHLNRMVVFDMDNTLLQGRFIDECAFEFGFHDDLLKRRGDVYDPVIMTKRIAQLVKGRSRQELLAVADRIPLVEDTYRTVAELRHRGYIIGIISDSYDFVVNHIQNKIGADFALANELEFSGGMATGEVKIPSFFFRNPQSVCNHTLCKTNALLELSNQYNIPFSKIIAIGDSLNDLCMIKNAGTGFAFCSDNELLNDTADFQIKQHSFRPVLENTY
ncbi:HAD-IB family phosphatase [Runella sp.]|uniref:HAD-IB family phosphatase n=1 Tax=Runella sp. TaxID=1960881 RepID=UPI003D11DF4D